MNQKKPLILLLSDDLRMPSGVATMARAIVMGLVDRYDFFQIGAAVKHPEQGKLLDVSDDIAKKTGVSDAKVRILPWTGYGNADLVRQVINSEQPDAIMLFTDPRYFVWLFEIEHEIRQNIPILYYTIWDNIPIPSYNAGYYESCDGLFTISKLTFGVVNNVLKESCGDKLEMVKL